MPLPEFATAPYRLALLIQVQLVCDVLAAAACDFDLIDHV